MLQHKGTMPIRTQRLLLRGYQARDAADIFKNYAADERVTRFLSWRPHPHLKSVEAFVSEQIANDCEHTYKWVIELAGEVVGSISTVRVVEASECCEIGYCLGHAFWGRGIMTEAARAVCQFLFGEVGFHRVFAKHDVDNPASGRVMERCNMVCEGRLREDALRPDGTFSDSLVYGVLNREFLPG